MKRPAAPAGATNLLNRVIQGDRGAGTALLELYRPLLLRYAEEQLGPRLRRKVGASDIVQLSIVEAWRTLEQFDAGGVLDFWNWLRRIVDNNLRDVNRSQKRVKSDSRREQSQSQREIRAILENLSDHRPIDPDRDLERQELLAEVNAALDRLPEEYRVVLRWRFADGWEYSRIGEKIHRSQDAARMLCNRAQDAFKKALGATRKY